MTILKRCRSKECRAADERDAGEFALEVGGVALAVLGVVQHGIDVVEDVPLGDAGVGVVGSELVQRPVGDVLAAVGVVFVVSIIEGESVSAITREVGRRRKMARLSLRKENP